MVNLSSKLPYFFLILICATTSCRSRKRTAELGSGSVKVIVTLKNIDDVNTTKLVALIYEISCNSSGQWARGEVSNEEKQELMFVVKNVRAGDTCDLRVSSINPPSEYDFLTSPGVLYLADDGVQLSPAMDGQLGGAAVLQRNYKLKSSASILSVPVTFKGAFPTNPASLVAELKCNPEFEGLATKLVVVKASEKRGEFKFESGIKAGLEFDCKQIQVRSAGPIKGKIYYGKINDFKVKQSEPNEAITAPMVTLEEVEIINTEGVVIVVTPGEACKDHEVYDLDLSRCVPRPVENN